MHADWPAGGCAVARGETKRAGAPMPPRPVETFAVEMRRQLLPLLFTVVGATALAT